MKSFRDFRRFRVNMIVGKKQVIVAGLTVLLGMAVFTNYAVSNAGRRNNTAPVNSGGGNNAPALERADRDGGEANYGDAQFVSGGSVIDDDVSAFFAQARLSKRESRDEAKELLQSALAGGDARVDEIQAIAMDAATLGNFIESEARVEAVLRAQGFSDVLCYISDKGTNIIVRTDGLTAQCAAKIKDALLSEVSVAAENITIVEIK